MKPIRWRTALTDCWHLPDSDGRSPFVDIRPGYVHHLENKRERFIFVAHPLDGRCIEINVSYSCGERKTLHCINCHSHFMDVRPSIKAVVVSKHFVRDLKNEEEMNSIIKDILDCANSEFSELHKFEENIDGNLIFRAKKGSLHLVYGVDKKMRIVFLRAFKNFSEYKKFLDSKKEIGKMLAHA